MKKVFIVSSICVALLGLSATVWPQVEEDIEEAQRAQDEAVYNARFSPRWLITYAEDLEGRGYSGEDCLKIVEAAKTVTEIYRKEIVAEENVSSKERMLRYADAMLKLTDDLMKYYRTSDKALLETIDKDKDEVLLYEK
ncbi:MAG: hypothetical protein WCI77_06205 [Candidatus Omnitrophota bacterium]